MAAPVRYSLLLGILLLAACVGRPAPPAQQAYIEFEREESVLADMLDDYMVRAMGRYDDPALAAYVQRVGERVLAQAPATNLTVRFTVLDTPAVAAFSLVGGGIYVSRGLLAHLNREDQLAAVLGHEIGHIMGRHHAKHRASAMRSRAAGRQLAERIGTESGRDVASVFGAAQISGYGREQELESDRLAVQYLARAGYDPMAAAEVMAFFQQYDRFLQEYGDRQDRLDLAEQYSIFATHPATDRRRTEILKEIAALPRPAGGTPSGVDSYLPTIDGMVYGLAAPLGVQRGRHFYALQDAYALSLPPTWRVVAERPGLAAVSPAGEAECRIALLDNPEAWSAERALREKLKSGRIVEGTTLRIGNAPAYSAVVEEEDGSGTTRSRVVAVNWGKKLFVMLGSVDNAGAFASYDSHFLSIAQSLRPLSATQTKRIVPLRLRVTDAVPGVAYRDLARGSDLPSPAAPYLEILNQAFPHGAPTSGQRVKLVQ